MEDMEEPVAPEKLMQMPRAYGLTMVELQLAAAQVVEPLYWETTEMHKLLLATAGAGVVFLVAKIFPPWLLPASPGIQVVGAMVL